MRNRRVSFLSDRLRYFFVNRQKFLFSEESDFSKSDFANNCEILWISDYLFHRLATEYFPALHFSALFNRDRIVLQPKVLRD